MTIFLSKKWWDERKILQLEKEIKELRRRYRNLRTAVNIEEEINGHTAKYKAVSREKDRAMVNLHIAEKQLKAELQERSMHAA